VKKERRKPTLDILDARIGCQRTVVALTNEKKEITFVI
jgi:hypothetical protein